MFQIYTKLEDVPEAFREHYRLSEGKYIPAVSDDHPLVVNSRKLLEEKNTAEAQVETLAGELESAKAGSLPRGHVAVPQAEAALLNKYKPLGTPEELETLKGEHSTLKAESEAEARDKHLRAVGAACGYDPKAFAALPEHTEYDWKDTDERDEQGAVKKAPVAKVKGADGVVTEKSVPDFLASSERNKPLLPALTVKDEEGTPLPAHGAGGGLTEKSLAAALAQELYGNNAKPASAGK